MGITLHDSLATIGKLTQAGKEVDIDELATTAYRQMYDALLEPDVLNSEEAVTFAKEQATLVEGLIRGYFKHIWPRLLAQYPKILFVEEEMHYDHGTYGSDAGGKPALRFMSKPDLVLATEDMSEVVYIEFKSTSSKKDAWMNSWATAVQLHSTIKAVEQTHGVKIDAVIVQGLYKGYEAYGKQTSPFCYAYRRKGNPPFTKDEFLYEFKYGTAKTPVWELDGGCKEWVSHMPEVVLADQFPQTPPIYIKEDLVENFFAQREMREMEIAGSIDAILNAEEDEVERTLNLVFPQRFDQCTPSFGSPCPYSRLCHGYVSDPLSEGFTLREPHHADESQRFALEKE